MILFSFHYFSICDIGYLEHFSCFFFTVDSSGWTCWCEEKLTFGCINFFFQRSQLLCQPAMIYFAFAAFCSLYGFWELNLWVVLSFFANFFFHITVYSLRLQFAEFNHLELSRTVNYRSFEEVYWKLLLTTRILKTFFFEIFSYSTVVQILKWTWNLND